MTVGKDVDWLENSVNEMIGFCPERQKSNFQQNHFVKFQWHKIGLQFIHVLQLCDCDMPVSQSDFLNYQ